MVKLNAIISFNPVPSGVPLVITQGTVCDMIGLLDFYPGSYKSGSIHVKDLNGAVWSINNCDITGVLGNEYVDSSYGSPITSNSVSINEYSLGTAISQGITNSGMLNSTPDTTGPLLDIANKLQQIIDKDNVNLQAKAPVIIPKINKKLLIL